MKVKIKLKESRGALGKRVWPSANPMYQKHLDIFGEPDTEIEKKLYLQLHKHFNTTSAWVKDNEPPLDAESVKALKSILSSGEYAEDFSRCSNSQATMLRGMFVPLEWVRKNAPGALEAMSPDTDVIDYNKPFPTNFTYKSQGKYGGVSSWTPNKRVARIFAGNRTRGGEISCVLYAKCDTGLFMSTAPFAKYKGGEYKKDHGINKLNPARSEQEFILFGECQVMAIQLRGPKKNKETKMNITQEQLQTIIKEELEAVIDEKKGSKRQRKKKAKKAAAKKGDRCTRIAKRKYDVWPSAYASGAVVKCRSGKIWKGLKEMLSEDDFKPHMMYNPKTGESMKADKHEEHEELAKKGYTHVDPDELRKVLKDEGGASGMDPFVKAVGKGMEDEIKKTLDGMPDVGQHKDKDYIMDDDDEINIMKEATYEDGSPVEESFGFTEYLNEEDLEEAVYAGKTVKLNKPMRGDVKKFKVYVNSGKKDAKGRIKAKKVNFGHGGTSAKRKGEKTMKIRKSNPKARKNFRARHNCDNPGPKTKARYWSCKKW